MGMEHEAVRIDMDVNAQPDAGATRAWRCAQTLLTKPECHCPTCLSEQIAVHGPRSRQSLATTPATSRARRP